MKEFTIQEQVYICKNANSKTLEQMAMATESTMTNVKNEFNNMKKDGRYEKYRKMSEAELQQLINKPEPESKTEVEPKNKLLDLNDLLFQQLTTLMDDSLSQEQLDQEIKISKQVVSVSQTIINNANLLLQAKKHFDSTKNDNSEIAPLLSLDK